ncbi:MAG: hydrolase, partial [Gemmatimonadaceae bacterium]|nr:hydrolase [Gemmatimonadaceae bacterium]
GAAAALVAASERPWIVRAVVSRGGRPDLARDSLPDVEAPTLLVVGSEDLAVIDFNRDALSKLRCLRRLRIVHGAGHLFEEPGAMAAVSALAREWFETYLVGTIGSAG